MAVIIPQVVTEDRASGAQVIDGGLKFNNDKSQYLTRTPSSAGNRNVWTWSGWVKKTNATEQFAMFSAGPSTGTSNSNYGFLWFQNNGVLYFHNNDGQNSSAQTNATFRDTGWYHIVAVHNENEATEKMKFYVNGTLQTLAYNLSTSTAINSTEAHYIGLEPFSGGRKYYDGHMSQVYLIDGQALGPRFFGFTDSLTGTWRPKRLREGDTSLNDGTTWSNDLSATDASFPAVNGFDGDLTTSVRSQGAGSTLTWTPTGGFAYTKSVRVYMSNTNYLGETLNLSLNGGTNVPVPTVGWYTLATGSGTIITISSSYTATYQGVFSAIEVDGEILTDSAVSAAFGTNGFHLPFDGNSPIGEDKSGRGNNWSPVNFGGSNTIEKATGALPILNTTQGGTVASGGSRGDISPSTPTAVQGTVKFDGTGDYLTIPNSTDFNFGSGDFTIECYAYFTSVSAETLLGQWENGTNRRSWLLQVNSGQLSCYLSADGTTTGQKRIDSAAGAITTNRWYHLAYARSGNTMRLFIDGTEVGSVDVTGFTNYANTQDTAQVGSQTNAGSNLMTGYISNARIIKGTGLYTSDFTPPTEQLTSVTNTKLLTCQSSATTTAAVSPNLGGINDGTVWSDYLSINTVAGGSVLNQPADAFSGKTWDFSDANNSGYSNDYTGSSITFSPPAGTLVGQVVKLYQRIRPSTVTINGTNATITTSGDTRICTVDLGSSQSITSVITTATTIGQTNAFGYLEVDGVRVKDPISPYGDVYATRSESSGSNILAVPLVGIATDVSNHINKGSARKTVTVTGGPTSSKIANLYSGSYYFRGNGNTDYLYIPGTFWSANGNATFECWIYLHSLNAAANGNGDGIFTSGNQGDFCVMSDGQLRVHPAAGHAADTVASLTTGRWYHIALTQTSTYRKIWIDGIEQELTTEAGSPMTQAWLSETGTPASRVADDGFYRNFLHANIQDVRIYDYAKYTSNFVVPSTNPDILPDTPSGVSGSSKLTKITDGAVYFDGTGDYLSFNSGSDLQFGSGAFTIECYVYPNSLSNYDPIIDNGSIAGNNQHDWRLYLGSAGEVWFDIEHSNGSYFNGSGVSAGVDYGVAVGKWNHIAITRSGNTVYTFVNGELRNSASFSGTIDSDYTTAYIGHDVMVSGTSYYFDGYISNLRVIKGTALYTSNFTPSTSALTNVTNTTLLCCQSATSATAAAVTPASISASGNAAASNFSPVNTDINTVRGQETGYATLNPLNNGHASAGGMTLLNGNLDATNGSTQRHIAANMSFPFPSQGKFYFEMTPGTQLASPVTSNIGFGDYNVGNTGATNSYQNFYTRGGAFYIQGSGYIVNDAAYAFGDGDTIGCAIDFDSNIVKWYRNGSLQQSLSFPAPTVAVWPHYVSYNSPVSANFGQKPFKFPPPEGFQPLSATSTLPATVITRSDQYVGIVTYTGNQTARTLPLNFAADFVWTKRRDASNSHQLYDQTRGNGNYLQTDGTGQADTDSASMSFGTNKGINLGSGTRSNETGVHYVAWAWKAGGGSGTAGQFWKDGIQYASAAAVPNFLTGSGIETVPDGCSIGTRQGFSIVTYAGDGSNAVIPHGLTEQPNFVIIKRRNGIKHWMIAFPSSNPSATSATDVGRYLKFDNTTGTDVAPFQWLYTQSDRLTIEQSSQGHNESGGTYVAYCWHNVPGLQKFGRYTGNNTTNNIFIDLGFRPAMVWIKNISSGGNNSYHWCIYDSERKKYNPNGTVLWASSSTNENNSGLSPTDSPAGNGEIDFLSNGFKLRSSGSAMGGPENYIYCAWAEAPTFNLFGGQSNAR